MKVKYWILWLTDILFWKIWEWGLYNEKENVKKLLKGELE